MKTKRFLALLLSAMLLLGVAFAFASCGDPAPAECTEHSDSNGDGICDTEGCGENVTVDLSQYLNDKGELMLFKGGAPTFKFVTGEDASVVETEVNSLAETLTKLATAPVTVDDADSEVQPVEILIGTVKTRGNNYIINKYDYGMKGYMVKQIGSKIVVIGGSDNALKNAVDYLKETVFGIRKTTKKFTDFAIASDKNYDVKQTGYTTTSVTIGGGSIKDYVIYASGGETATELATNFQIALYTKTGIHLDIVPTVSAGTKAVKFLNLENDGAGDGYSVYVDDSSNLVFECEFAYKFSELATATYTKKITDSTKASVTLAKGAVDGQNIRDIWYEDFGAKGDGENNDFEAIRQTHEIANLHGHTVNANKYYEEKGNATYYIGSTGGKSAIVMTNTYWHGASFIFDDTVFEVHNDYDFSSSQQDMCRISNCSHCADRNAPIFSVKSDAPEQNVADLFAQFTSQNPLKGGYGEPDNTKVIPGWTLDYTALVYIQTSERKQFLRTGVNKDGGDHQLEVILVHPGGIIDDSTPVTYDYNSISWARAYNADERYVKPITIDGGGAMVETLANNPKNNNRYNAVSRNISIRRSNTTVMNIDHRVTEDQEWRAPYAGFVTQIYSNNITYKNLTLDKHKGKFEIKHNGESTSQGTYEIGGSYSNNIKYINVKVVNFFYEGEKYDYMSAGAQDGDTKAGEVAYRGCMGTNYVRNFYFNGCVLTSFDAHKGLGNAKFENCVFEHLNIQGSGDVYIEDTAIYTDGSRSVFNLRSDYGPSWNGSVTVKNVDLYYNKQIEASKPHMIINTQTPELSDDYDTVLVEKDENGKEIYESDGKCTLYLPKKITVENVNIYKYTYTTYTKYTGTHEEYADVVDGRPAALLDTIDMKIIESETNKAPIYLYNPFVNSSQKDLAVQNKSEGRITTIAPTEEIIINNCHDLIILPETLHHRNAECTVDGKPKILY